MVFVFECRLRAGRGAVFAFHADPGNLLVLHGEGSGLRVLRHGGGVEPGNETWVEQRVGPMPVVMGFRHVVYEPPERFSEMMIHGPFRRFEHVHEFEEMDGGTLVRDRLEIDLPYWLGGEWGMRWVAGPLVEEMFHRRREAYARLEASGAFREKPVEV